MTLLLLKREMYRGKGYAQNQNSHSMHMIRQSVCSTSTGIAIVLTVTPLRTDRFVAFPFAQCAALHPTSVIISHASCDCSGFHQSEACA